MAHAKSPPLDHSLLVIIITGILTILIVFPKFRQAILPTIANVNRAFAIAVGWLFVLMLWPWIALLNYLNPYEVPYLVRTLDKDRKEEEKKDRKEHKKKDWKEDTNPVKFQSIQALRQWHQMADENKYPSVFSGSDSDG